MADSIRESKGSIAREYFKRSGSLLLNATGSYFTEAMPSTTSTVSNVSATFNEYRKSTASILSSALKTRSQLNAQAPIKALNTWFLNKSNTYGDQFDDFSTYDIDIENAAELTKTTLSVEEQSADKISKTFVDTSHKMVEAQITATANILTSLDKVAATNAAGFDNVNRRLDKLIEVVTKNTSTLINATVAANAPNNSNVGAMIKSGKFDFNTYMKSVKSNISNSEAGMMASMASMLLDLHKTGMMTPELVTSVAFDGIINKMAPSLKKNLKAVDTIIGNTIMESLMRLGDQRNKDGLMGQLGKMLGIDRNARPEINNRATVKGVAFDNITRNAIVDVLPTYMREILVQLGGDNLVYNHKTGKFSKINRNRHDVHFSSMQESNGSYGSISTNGTVRGRGMQGVDYSNAALYEIYKVLSTGINVYNVGTETSHVQNSRFKHSGFSKPAVHIGQGKIDTGSSSNYSRDNRDRTTLYDIFSGKSNRDNILTNKDAVDDSGNPLTGSQRNVKWAKTKGKTLLSSLFTGRPEDFVDAFRDATLDLGDAFMKSNLVAKLKTSVLGDRDSLSSVGKDYFTKFREFFSFQGDPNAAKKMSIIARSIGTVGGGILAGPIGMLSGNILASAIDFSDPKKGLGQGIREYLFGKNYESEDGKKKHEFGLIEKLTNPIKYQIGKTADLLKGQLKHNLLNPLKDIGFAIKDRITNAAGGAASKLFNGIFKLTGWLGKGITNILKNFMNAPSSIMGRAARGGISVGGGLLGGGLRSISNMLYKTDEAKDAARDRRKASRIEYSARFGKYELDDDGNVRLDDNGNPIKVKSKDNTYRYRSYKSFLESESNRLVQKQEERDSKRESREETQASNIQTITDVLTKNMAGISDQNSTQSLLATAGVLAATDGSVNGGEASDLENMASEIIKKNPNEGRSLSFFNKMSRRFNKSSNNTNSTGGTEEKKSLLDSILDFLKNPLMIAGIAGGIGLLLSNSKIRDKVVGFLGDVVSGAGTLITDLFNAESDSRKVADATINVGDSIVDPIMKNVPGFENSSTDLLEIGNDIRHGLRTPTQFKNIFKQGKESVKLARKASKAGMSVQDYVKSKSLSNKVKTAAINVGKKGSSYLSDLTARLNGIDLNIGINNTDVGTKPVKNIWNTVRTAAKNTLDDIAIWGISIGQRLASKWDNAIASSRKAFTFIGSKLDDTVKVLSKTKVGKSLTQLATNTLGNIKLTTEAVEFFSKLKNIPAGKSLETIFKGAGKIFAKGGKGIFALLKFCIKKLAFVLDFIIDGMINIFRSDEIFDKDPELVTGVNQISAFSGGAIAGSGDGIFDDFDPSDIMDILFNALKWAGLGGAIFATAGTVAVPILGTVAGGVVGAIGGAILGAIFAAIGGDNISRGINAVLETLCKLMGVPTGDETDTSVVSSINSSKLNVKDASSYLTGNRNTDTSMLNRNGIGNGYGYTALQGAYSDPRMKNGGCGPIAASRYFSKSGSNIPAGTFANIFDNGGFRNTKGGTHISAFRDLGMNVTANPNQALNELRNGNKVILQGKGGAPFTNSGHYVVAEGMNGSNVKLYDPLRGNTTASWNSLQGNIDYAASGGYGYGGTNGTNYQNFPLYHQGKDAPWADLSYGSTNTIGGSGCGPTSMAMVLSAATGQSITPDKLAKWSVDNGYRYEGKGTAWGFFPAIGNQYGLTTEEGGTNLQFLDKSLSEGEPVILSGTGGRPFTSGGHFIVAVGKDKDGNYLINDPAGHSGSYSADTLSGVRNMWSFNKNGAGFLNSKYVPTYDSSAYDSSNTTASLTGLQSVSDSSYTTTTEENQPKGFLGGLMSVFGNITKGLGQWFTGTGAPKTYAEVAGESMSQTLGISSSSYSSSSNSLSNFGSNNVTAANINYTGDVAKTIWNFFKNKGFKDHQVAGILGNMYAESKLNPGINEIKPLIAGSRGGYGLCQWTGSRRDNLESFAASTGRAVNDTVMQCEFLWNELNSTHKSALAGLSSATTVYEASTAFLVQFEKPKDQGEAVRNQRASYAQKFYDTYHTDPSIGTASAKLSGSNYKQNPSNPQMYASGYGNGDGGTTSHRNSGIRNNALIKKHKNSSSYAQGYGYGNNNIRINNKILGEENEFELGYGDEYTNPVLYREKESSISTLKLEQLFTAALSELKGINRNTSNIGKEGYGYGDNTQTKVQPKPTSKKNAKFAIPSTSNYSSASSVLAIAKGY